MPIVGNKKYRYTKKGIAAAKKAMKKYAAAAAKALASASGKAITKYDEGGGPVVGDLLDTLKGLGKEGGLKTNVGGFDSSEAAVSSFAKGKSRMRDLQAQAAAAFAKSGEDETPSTPADPLGSGNARSKSNTRRFSTGVGSGMGGVELGIEKKLGVGKRKSNTSEQRDDSFSKDLADEFVRENRDGGSANEPTLKGFDGDEIFALSDTEFEDIEDEEEQVDKRTQRKEGRREVNARKKAGRKAAFKNAAGKVGGLMKKFREGYDRQTRKQPGYRKAKSSYSSYDHGGTVGEPSGPPYATSGPRANVPEETIISGIKRSGEKLYTQPIIKAVNNAPRPSINSLRRNTVFRSPLKPIVKPSQEFVNRRSIPSVTLPSVRRVDPIMDPKSRSLPIQNTQTNRIPSLRRETITQDPLEFYIPPERRRAANTQIPSVTKGPVMQLENQISELENRPFIKNNQYIYPKK